MTILEAKTKLTSEFIARYNEWFADLSNLSDTDYGKKYGWAKPEKATKKNQASFLYFGKFIFSAYGEFIEWVNAGYDRELIFALNENGFLGCKTKDWKKYFFISQAAIKQIYNDIKEGDQ